MADHVQRGAPAPRDLVYAWRTWRWGLPLTGGWLEQPAGLVDRMEHALRVWEVLDEYRRLAPGSVYQWIAGHAAEWELVQRIERLRRV